MNKPLSPGLPVLPSELIEKAREERVRIEARRMAMRELDDAKFNPPAPRGLDQILASGVPSYEWTIDKLAAKRSNVFLLGNYKAGKSALTMNLIKSLADCEPFLCTYPVRLIAGKIGYVDFEMGELETHDRLKALGVHNTPKVVVFDLVGRAFDIMSDTSYEWLVEQIVANDIEVLVLDPLRHVAFKKDGNSDAEIQRITSRIDQLRVDAPCLVDIFIPSHSRKETTSKGEDINALGSAAWDGWAHFRWGSYRTKEEGVWRYWFCLLPSRRNDADAMAVRQVDMDHQGRLSLGVAGSTATTARSVKQAERRKAAVAFVAANQPTTKNEIFKTVKGGRNETMALIDAMHNEELWIDSDKNVWTYEGYLDHLSKV